jgi:PST family polysaccharide transporter
LSIYRQSILENTSVLIVGQVLAVLLSFVGSIFLIRNLGSTEFGEYVFIYAFLSLFGWLVTFGTDNILVREAALYPNKAGAIWLNGLIIQQILSVVAIVLMIGFALVIGYSEKTIILLIIASIEVILLIPWRLVSRILQVELQQWRAVTATLARQLLWLVILIIFANHPISLIPLVIVRTLTAFIEIALMLYFARPYLNLEYKFNSKLIKKIVNYSWPLALASLSIAVYHRVDRVLIEYYLDAKPLGLYATADNFAKMMSVIPFAFMTSIFPVMSKQTVDTNKFSRLADVSYRWIIGWSVFLAGILVIIGPVLVNFFYGDEFSYSGELLRILVWSQVAGSFGVVISQILISQDLQRFITVSTVIGACLNLIGNILVISRYGIVGVSFVTLFSYFIASMICFVIFPSTRNYARYGFITTIKIMLIAILALLVSSVIDRGDLVSIAIYVVLFGTGLYLFNIVPKEDILLIQNIIRGFILRTKALF